MTLAAALLLPATGAVGSVVVAASLLGAVELVVEVADDDPAHADDPKPTATRPRATNSLRTLRGYPGGRGDTLAPCPADDDPPTADGPRPEPSYANPARLQMCSAIASDAVAAGEGALRTSRTLPRRSSQKSSTSDPSRSIA